MAAVVARPQGLTDHVWTIGELVDAALNGTLATAFAAA